MSKLLYVIANPLNEDQSFSVAIGKEFIHAYKESAPHDEIIELNLFNENIPEIDADVLDGWGKLRAGVDFSELSNNQQAKISQINKLTDQFMEADKYVFVSPLWNLGMPPRLKAYIDTFVIAGKTFKYTENGPVGLLDGKKAIHIQARGGFYSEGPAKELEHGDSFLRAVLGFIGIDLDTIVAEGHAFMPDAAEEIKRKAVEKAVDRAKTFANEFVEV